MKRATTLEELKEILTEDTWVPHMPDYRSSQHCLYSATSEISEVIRQIKMAIRPSGRTVSGWNDSQTSVNAVHDMIDKAIEIRDQSS